MRKVVYQATKYDEDKLQYQLIEGTVYELALKIGVGTQSIRQACNGYTCNGWTFKRLGRRYKLYNLYSLDKVLLCCSTKDDLCKKFTLGSNAFSVALTRDGVLYKQYIVEKTDKYIIVE